MKSSNAYPMSVLLVSYNHQSYIEKALHSIIDQDYDGPIELLVADDCSSDYTVDIIRNYEDKDSRIHFKYLESPSNIGITRNYQRGFAACSGKFVAVLEGDDYWTSPSKLKRQTEFLEKHPECNLCSVNYLIYDELKDKFTVRSEIKDSYRLLGAKDLIFDNLIGNFSTCMYRKSALDELPHRLFEIKSYDWIVNICIASQSLVGFIETPMSVYRVHKDGVWSKKTQIEKLKEQLDIIPAYDALTNMAFHKEFDQLKEKLTAAIDLRCSANPKKQSSSRNIICDLFARLVLSAKRIYPR